MAAASSVQTPPITWAQRKDSLYITINLSDVDSKTAKIELLPNKLTFTGASGGKDWAAELEFFAEVDPSDANSKFDIKPRSIQFHVMKKDKESEFWPRLLKDKAKEKNQVKIDWTRYVDEDEEKGGFDMSNFGPGAMNFGGMGGDEMGGMMGGMGGMMGGMGGGMGGFGGGGMGGGGMDMQALMASLGGAGGMGGLGGAGMGGMDFSSMMGGPGGEGGDSDDDDLPDLAADDEAPAGESKAADS